MSVRISFPSRDTAKYIEGPTGFFTVPLGLSESPPGSGLYDVPSYLVETFSGSGVYEIPLDYIGTASHFLSNVKNFSVQEDATPVEPSSSFGGVGRITFNIEETDDSPLLLGEVTLADGSKGKTSGSIVGVSSTDGDLSITADSAIGLFNTDRIVPPYVGTLGGAIQYYADLVGITNDVVVDLSVSSRSVTYPGWTGNVWVKIKELFVKEQVEMALVFDRVYVRSLRQLVATLQRSTTLSWSNENTNAARAIDINYYNHSYGTQCEIYPPTDSEPTIYQVDASETVVITQQLNASIISLNQPVVQNWVGDTSYAGTTGVYSVVGNDGLPITAAQWTAQGGSVTVTVMDDPSILEITIRGANMPDYAPYRIAMSSGSGNYYNSLHITATAVIWDKRTLRIPTGATNVTTSDEVGPVIDNPFINTLSEAYSLGMKAAQANAGLNYIISGTALDINRTGTGQELVAATIADFNLTYVPGTTIATFNTVWSGQDIAALNTYFQDQVNALFENQLFGNAPGARILRSDANFRVNSATTGESTVQFSASLDTLLDDFSDKWTGETIADFNAQFIGYTCKDFSIMPLRRN